MTTPKQCQDCETRMTSLCGEDKCHFFNVTVVNLRSRCWELERENKRLLELCDSHLMTMANIRLEEMAIRKERDESWSTYQREIGARSIVEEENADLRDQLAKARGRVKTYFSRYDEEITRAGIYERMQKSLESDNDKLRAQLAEQVHQVKLLNGIVTGMRYQVIVARNSVLLDIDQAMQAMYPKYGGAALDDVRTAIRKIRKQGDDENDG